MLQTYPELEVGGFSRDDHVVAFYSRVASLVDKNSIVLDFGAGPGGKIEQDPNPWRRDLRTLKGRASQVIGVDVDPRVLSNKELDRAMQICDGARIELDDSSVDVIVCRWVFEHIRDPTWMTGEFERLVKVGGWICALTPNKLGYVALGNTMLSGIFKDKILSVLQPRRKSENIYPAYYRLNTTRALRRYFRPDQWKLITINIDVPPAYSGGSRILWTAFRILAKLTPEFLLPHKLVFIQKVADSSFANRP